MPKIKMPKLNVNIFVCIQKMWHQTTSKIMSRGTAYDFYPCQVLKSKRYTTRYTDTQSNQTVPRYLLWTKKRETSSIWQYEICPSFISDLYTLMCKLRIFGNGFSRSHCKTWKSWKKGQSTSVPYVSLLEMTENIDNGITACGDIEYFDTCYSDAIGVHWAQSIRWRVVRDDDFPSSLHSLFRLYRTGWPQKEAIELNW